MTGAVAAGPEPTRVEVAGPAGRLVGWLWEAVEAERAPVVLIHPINLQGRVWDGLVALLPRDRTYVALDLRAHGGSDPDGELGLDPWLEDVTAVVDALVPDRPFHVVGGSLGGSLAVCVARALPERVLSVTGLGSSLNFAGVDPNGTLELFDELGVAGAFARVLPEHTFGPDVSPDLVGRALELANPNDVDVVKRVWRATVTSDSTDRARGLAVPALVVTGELDTTCTPALGLEMARVLGTHQVLLPGTGHLPMLEHPHRVAPLLTAHLRAADAHLAR